MQPAFRDRGDDRLAGLLDRLDDPRDRLMIALVAIHALLPGQLVRLLQTDLDYSKGRLRLRRPGHRDHLLYLDAIVLRLATAWELARRQRWPDSSNPHLFVTRHNLPRGWDTLLARGYQDGHILSGGQWQKLGIARAHFRAGQVLVVDEPTAALDAKAEQQAFANIRTLAAGGQTVVLITHRLHSVRSADLIYLLEDGRVAESGTFTELMDPATAPDGRFRAMYEIQRAQFAADDEAQPAPLQR